ncbi:hypothetical protein G9A89_010252 [Geosiphon pyriformis]|nr:hypothetical protein G9A89_010252 [Geosiphon pyriformis]
MRTLLLHFGKRPYDRFVALELFFLIIYLTIFLPNVNQAAPQTNILYREEEEGLVIWNVESYMTGDALLRLVKFTSPLPTTNNNGSEQCVDNTIRLRLVRLDSTVKKINFVYPGITNINFCQDLIKIHPLMEGFILLTFFKEYQETGPNSHLKSIYHQNGLVMDWNEKIIAEIQFGNVTADTFGKIKNGVVAVNINPESGFLFANYYSNTNVLNWAQFNSPEKNFQQISASNIPVPWNNTDVEVFPTADGGYGFLVTGVDPIIDQMTNSTQTQLVSQWRSKAYFLNPHTYNISNDGISVYDLKTPAYNMYAKNCEIMDDGTGFKCILFISTNPNSASTSYVQTLFMSNGEVLDAKPLNIRSDIDIDWVKPLSSGLIFLAGFMKGTKNIIGQIYSENGDFNSTSNYNVSLNKGNLATGIFPNETAFVFVPLEKDSKTWSMNMVDLVGNSRTSNSFINQNILESSPAKDESAVELQREEISITFKNPVQLSTANVTIYQITSENSPVFKQTFSANSSYVNLTNGDTALVIRVLKSTFNTPGGKYSVVVDNNFIKSRDHNVSLVGVSDWTFTTAANLEQQNSQSQNGLVRLTEDGTSYLKSLSATGRKDFFVQIATKLREILPISEDSILSSGNSQFDSTTGRLLIMYQVYTSPDLQSYSVPRIIDDLDLMIRNKAISAISYNNITDNLDENFGFQKPPSLWEQNKITLLLISGGLVFLLTLTLLIHFRSPKGNAYFVFKVVLYALTILMNFWFVFEHGQDILFLFLPSLVFLFVPIGFNSFLSAFIQLRERIRNNKYAEWSCKHRNVATFFGVLSFINVDILTITQSYIMNLETLKAPFSPEMGQWIFYSNIFNLLIQDVPQFVILVLYHLNIVRLSLVPFLALIAVFLMILNNLISRIYYAYIICKHKTQYTVAPERDDRPGMQLDPYSHPLQVHPSEIVAEKSSQDSAFIISQAGSPRQFSNTTSLPSSNMHYKSILKRNDNLNLEKNSWSFESRSLALDDFQEELKAPRVEYILSAPEVSPTIATRQPTWWVPTFASSSGLPPVAENEFSRMALTRDYRNSEESQTGVPFRDLPFDDEDITVSATPTPLASPRPSYDQRASLERLETLAIPSSINRRKLSPLSIIFP